MTKNYNEIQVKPIDVHSGEEVKDEERVKKEVVVTKVSKKIKKGLVERLVSGMIGPDGIPSITSYLNKEIVVPALKNIVYDSFTSGLDMFMFRGDSPRNGASRNTGGYQRPPQQNTNYGAKYQPMNNHVAQPSTYAQPIQRNHATVETYLINDRNEALMVLDNMMEQINTYGVISVADYYDMIGVDSNYTDNTYGWSGHALNRATIRPARNGFVLDLPPVQVIG